MDETQIALFDEIRQREAPMRVVARDADDEPQVALDHRLPRVEVAGPRRAGETQFLGGGQQRMLADIVQVELRNVGDEVPGQARMRLVERQVGRVAVRLRRRVLGCVGVGGIGRRRIVDHAVTARRYAARYAGGR